MFITRRSGVLFAVGMFFAGVGCGNGPVFMQPDGAPANDAAMADSGTVSPDAPRDAPRDTRPIIPLLLAVEPSHGAFSGGTSVTLRGANLSMDMTVTFGGNMVQPRYVMLMDSHRLVVQTPAGVPGPVDVAVQLGSQTSSLPQGFTYDSFYADPSSGSVAGGTLITLRGQNTNWTTATTVLVDATPCTSITLVSPSQITCAVPMHPASTVAITVTTGTEAVTVPDAFTYYDGADRNSGGFGGGHISGNINVSVLNELDGTPVPNAYVYVGNDPLVAPPLSGVANTAGQITLSSPTLVGPVTVTASAHCFATTTFVSIDGRDATIYLLPWLGRVPGVDCGMAPPSGGPPRQPIYAATISGELIWTGPREFGPNPWSNVPMPHANERRIAYVMTTTDSILSGNPDPGMGGTVLEVIPPDYGGMGYAYTITARPAAVAVYAIAGLERTDVTPPKFTPYVMGVARGVLGAPRAMLTNVNVYMDIPLDHETSVTMHNVPTQNELSLPDRFRVEGWVDLGGEGVIPRPDITVYGRASSDPYRLVALPAFVNNLADARLTVRATYGNGSTFDDPESTVIVGGITTPDDTLDVRDWVGIPQITMPLDGGTIPANRQITFGLAGNSPDFFWTVISQSGSSCRIGFYLGDVVWWQHHFAGTNRSFGVPDISMVPGLTDMPHGLYRLSLCGIRVPGFAASDGYNNFRYQYLSQYYWSAYGTNAVTIAR